MLRTAKYNWKGGEEIMTMEPKNSDQIQIGDAMLPEELVMDVPIRCGCQGDGCNADQGGCTHDATCGQDC